MQFIMMPCSYGYFYGFDTRKFITVLAPKRIIYIIPSSKMAGVYFDYFSQIQLGVIITLSVFFKIVMIDTW